MDFSALPVLGDLLGFDWADTFSFAHVSSHMMLSALTVFLGLLVAIYVFRHFVLKKLDHLVARTNVSTLKMLTEVLGNISSLFYTYLALYFAVGLLDLSLKIYLVLDIVLIVLGALEILRFSRTILDYIVHQVSFLKKRDGTTQAIMATLKVAIWGCGFLLILSTFNIDTSIFSQIFSAVVTFSTFLVGLYVFRNFFLIKLEKITAKTENDIDDKVVEILENISSLFYWFLALYFTAKLLLPLDYVQIERVLDGIFIVLAVFEATKVVQSVISFSFQRVSSLRDDKTTLHAINLLVKIVLWAIGLLLVLSNLGFNVSTLAASLGIGGVAIALAAQNILGDLFASFSLFFDKPLAIGDYIVVGEHSGTVKRIGLKTTRLTTLQGEELVISNKELTESRIQNFKKMKRRRKSFGIGVVYGTAPEKLKKVPDIIRKIIDAQELTETDRVHFHEFGAYSLNFEIVYYINSRHYHEYMDVQQAINLAIAEAFAKEGLEMAFPTRTVYSHSVK